MQVTTELSAGAIGIILSIISSSAIGISVLVAIYLKVRTDITRLDLGHVEVKNDIAEIKADLSLMKAQMSDNKTILERISVRQELTAVQDPTNAITAALGRLFAEHERRTSKS